ncbi:MAG TPA: hypothetical protein VGR00_14900, partial [Thermoanaerobaculia bacterium]|nr:hypothetical protein [Thermoanaerobaculia bacterium]
MRLRALNAGLVKHLPIPSLLVASAALATVTSTIPWTELTPADWLMDVSTRKADVDGRTIHYPAPTRELAEALKTKSESPEAATRRVAWRHLAEARRELGDRAGAEAALEAWAKESGADAPAAWAEASRWGARYGSFAFAFRAAEKALAPASGASPDAALARERISWAEAHPDLADPLTLRAARAALFPEDPDATEDWIRALEKANRIADAEAVLAKAKSLPEERRLLVLSSLKRDHKEELGAHAILETYAGDAEKSPSTEALRAFAASADKTAAASRDGWRASLDRKYDARALLLLARYFEGKDRGDLVRDLLVQTERRYESTFDRPAALLVSRLWDSVDAVPEAFRMRLRASFQKGPGGSLVLTGGKEERLDDLAALVPLALRAGARPLAWGSYGDEPYRWAARLDVTPGFFTGGLSFLLTGFGREQALAELEARRLPDRTFETARLLFAEIEKRSPKDRRLPRLAVALMARHVERGEGAAAIALAPKAEAGDEAVRAEAKRVALLAARQTKMPLEKEVPLWQERLALLAPDGTLPFLSHSSSTPREEETPSEAEGEGGDGETESVAPPKRSLRGVENGPKGENYGDVLVQALARLDARDRSHRAALSLLLHELDRLPKAESLWLFAADRIESFRLEDGLEARYRQAMETFGGAGWWNRLARWYARRERASELKALADDAVARFRGAEIFARDPNVNVPVPAEDQPNPYIRFA